MHKAWWTSKAGHRAVAAAICALLLVSMLALAKEKIAKGRTADAPSQYFPDNIHIDRFPVPHERHSLDDTYLSTDVPHPIPDPGTVESVLNITTQDTIRSLNVYVAISHPWVRDLVITLIAPNDSAVMLLTLFPANAVDSLDGWFDDAAAVGIHNAQLPLVGGTWRPMEPLSRFTGMVAAGTWRLRIQDQWAHFSGFLGAWGLEINPEQRLTGRVRNSLTRDPVENVIVESVEDGSQTRTLRNGTYVFTRISYGTRTLRFFREDYDTLTVPGVNIEAGQVGQLDTVLTNMPRRYEFVSTARAVAIADTALSSMILHVDENVVIDTITVTVNLTHTYDEDLILRLISPQNRKTVVLAFREGSDGDNYTDCTFDDHAANSITNGVAPFTGHFQPQSELSVMRLDSTAGDWTLAVTDTNEGDFGTIDNFTLHVRGHLPNSRLRGVILNQFTRQPLPNAWVEIVETGDSARTDRQGKFVFSAQPDSLPHLVRISKPHYETLQVPVTVAPHTTVDLDTALAMPAGHFEYDSPAGTAHIPDDPDSTAELSLTVGQDIVIIDSLSVTVNITHPRDRDLTFWLASPRDTILLANHVGGDSANFVNCVFDDGAATSITEGIAPFTGLYRPLQPLNVLHTDTARGLWTLMVKDSVDSLYGTLNDFSMHIVGQWIDLAVDDPQPVARNFEFYPNFPNPFNSRTEFRFDIPRHGMVSLVLYNILGQKAAVVTQQFMEAGSHRISFDAGALASGIYIARLQTAGSAQSRKVVLLR